MKLLTALAALAAIGPAHATISLIKRDSPAVVAAPAVNIDGGYFVNVSVGTPPQPLAMLMLVDEIASTLVFHDPSDNETCYSDILCGGVGYFNYTQSSSFSHNRTNNFDVFELGDTTVNATFDVYPSLGGYYYNQMGAAPNSSGSSFPYQLVANGLINTPSLSIWRNPNNEHEAEILFGGVNAAKYHGPLQAHRMNDTAGFVTLPVSGLSIKHDNGTSSSYALDEAQFMVTSGDVTFLPDEVAHAIYRQFDIPLGTNDEPYPTIPCPAEADDDKRTIALEIGNLTISSPWTRFLIVPDDRETCYFTMFPVAERLGGTWAGGIPLMLLQDAYLALDYGSMMVGIAPLNYEPGDDDILEFEAETRMPDATGDFPDSLASSTAEPKTGLTVRITLSKTLLAAAVMIAIL